MTLDKKKGGHSLLLHSHVNSNFWWLKSNGFNKVKVGVTDRTKAIDNN
jgi:hypothetical protein